MNETAEIKLANLQTLQLCAEEQRIVATISVDKDGYYSIGEKMFIDYKAALKFIVNLKQ